MSSGLFYLLIILAFLLMAILSVTKSLIKEVKKKAIQDTEEAALKKVEAIEQGFLERQEYLKRSTDALEDAYSSKKERLERDLEFQHGKKKKKLDGEIKDLEEKRDRLQKTILEEQDQKYPWMARLFADFNYAYDERIARSLRYKSRPAIKASEQVKAIGREKRNLQVQCKQLEYQLNFYESLFPWLEDFREIPAKEAFEYVTQPDDSGEYESLRKWLSPEEYNNLPTIERNQLALERWRQRKKSNWEIGIEYERYIGYLKEREGCTIKYQGALKGLEDMGRDLLAYKGDDIEVIQCKRWAQDKVIHEKHIFQLYGTMVLERIENPSKNIMGIFVMTNELSETAKKCADVLSIKVQKIPMEEYPVIKCNISQRTGERIYHLPFDQQYDKIVIDASRGEFYAHTVREAEDLGFRRAYRWQGDKT